jgi:hypothetical protein
MSHHYLHQIRDDRSKGKSENGKTFNPNSEPKIFIIINNFNQTNKYH